jgi:hypothetical protein
MILASKTISGIPIAGRRPRWIVLPVLVCLAMRTAPGHAQGADAEMRTVARELARQGADAFEQRDYATALDRLTRAYSLFRAPTISLMQARALARLGRLVEALDKYEETQRLPLGDEPPDPFLKAVGEAKHEAEQLRARVPRLSIQVRAVHGRLEGLSVQLDGKPVPSALLDVERPVDPGMHQVTVKANAYAPVVRQAQLAEGDRVAIEIALDVPRKAQLIDEPEAKPPAPDAVRISTDDPSPTPVWGWLGVGVGTVGLAAFGISGVVALQKKSDLDAVCRPGCPASAAQDIDSFRTMRTISYVSLVAGAASLGVGGYLLLSGSPESAHIAVSVGPANASIGGAF